MNYKYDERCTLNVEFIMYINNYIYTIMFNQRLRRVSIRIVLDRVTEASQKIMQKLQYIYTRKESWTIMLVKFSISS